MDVRCSVALDNPVGYKKKTVPMPVVDVVVGDVHGMLFLHSDLLRNLVNIKKADAGPAINLVPQKMHWHRQAVNTVKWSLDGKSPTENIKHAAN